VYNRKWRLEKSSKGALLIQALCQAVDRIGDVWRAGGSRVGNPLVVFIIRREHRSEQKAAFVRHPSQLSPVTKAGGIVKVTRDVRVNTKIEAAINERKRL